MQLQTNSSLTFPLIGQLCEALDWENNAEHGGTGCWTPMVPCFPPAVGNTCNRHASVSLADLLVKRVGGGPIPTPLNSEDVCAVSHIPPTQIFLEQKKIQAVKLMLDLGKQGGYLNRQAGKKRGIVFGMAKH